MDDDPSLDPAPQRPVFWYGAALFACGGLITLGYAGYAAVVANADAPTTCTVVASDVESRLDTRERQLFRAVVRVRYAVDGDTYEATDEGAEHDDRADAAREAATMPVGASVHCAYVSSFPSVARVFPSRSSSIAIPIGAGLLLLVLAIVLYVTERARARRPAV